MASPVARGRMILKTIAESEGVASLSPVAAVLFMMLIPHFNSYGKMQAGPGTVKDDIVPLLTYFTYENLPDYLQEISNKTNVKWFRSGNKWWLHSLHFNTEHQELRADKMGVDNLPSYTGGDPVLSLELVPDSPSAREGLKVGSKEERLKKPTTTHARVGEILTAVLKDKREVLVKRFPQCRDLDLVVEKLIAYQGRKGVPTDPWLVMLQWFQKEFTGGGGDGSGNTGRARSTAGKAKGVVEPNQPGTDWTGDSEFATG